MKGSLTFLWTSLLLHARNRMALLYGYLFPLVFLGAFLVLYRHESVPLLQHLGELLTVTILGGACFGLPTTLVSERERGVWRLYRLTPTPVAGLLAGTLVARYLILLSAGLLQVAVALAAGMAWPIHPLALMVAFSVVAFSFIGLGLVVAMLVDSVPAVQALGQCIFLPMLILGGVAVPLASLPEWGRRVASFFPGRYAVEALQAVVTGGGLDEARGSLGVLVFMGLAGFASAILLFRWENGHRAFGGKRIIRLLPLVVAWTVVGLWAGQPEARPAAVLVVPAVVPPPPPQPAWRRLTAADGNTIDFEVPPDEGIFTPFAPPDEPVSDYVREDVDALRAQLAVWPPGNDGDHLVAVRNLLCVAAGVDFLQLPMERQVPPALLQHLRGKYPPDELVSVLTWICLHPEEGILIGDLSALGLPADMQPAMADLRQRVHIYAVKFLGRLTGRIPGPASLPARP